MWRNRGAGAAAAGSCLLVSPLLVGAAATLVVVAVAAWDARLGSCLSQPGCRIWLPRDRRGRIAPVGSQGRRRQPAGDARPRPPYAACRGGRTELAVLPGARRLGGTLTALEILSRPPRLLRRHPHQRPWRRRQTTYDDRTARASAMARSGRIFAARAHLLALVLVVAVLDRPDRRRAIPLPGSRVHAGDIPYRDFDTYYTPGIFYLYSWMFSLFGVSVMPDPHPDVGGTRALGAAARTG